MEKEYNVAKTLSEEDKAKYDYVYQMAKSRLYNMSAVCKLAGVSGNAFRLWVYGTGYLSLEKIEKIIEVLNRI